MSSHGLSQNVSRLFGRQEKTRAAESPRAAEHGRLPNLIIAGQQKSGTTWLHHTLKKSSHFQEPDKKELDFFNQRDFAGRLDEYAAHFPEEATETYLYESSPNYFQPPDEGRNVAANIAHTLESPEIIVLFRNPVDRYQSAYVHHMGAGRFPYAEQIDDLSDKYLMLTRGKYAMLLESWLEQLPKTRMYLYDDLRDKPALIERVMRDLRVENDIPDDQLEFSVNTASAKQRKNNWPVAPTLSDDARSRLMDIYAPEVERLQAMIGRDLSHWLQVA